MSEILNKLRQEIKAAYLMGEADYLAECLNQGDPGPELRQRISQRAFKLVAALREDASSQQGLDAFLSEYDLSSEEGVVLMCLAEALLRIPDSHTADKLIRDKLSKGQWDEHLGQSSSSLVNASTWGLMLTGRIIQLSRSTRRDIASFFKNLTAKAGEPVIRLAITEAMGIMGQQFVLGESIEQAVQRSERESAKRYLFSFDMLGEAALTQADAERFFDAYVHAIEVIGSRSDRAAISVKLSALHPRYVLSQQHRVQKELTPRLLELALLAKKHDLMMTVDAEEADRLELNLDVFERVFSEPGIRDWSGLGIVVQAYQKRALSLLRWLNEIAAARARSIPVRLVKGAYWDTEIKRSQTLGLDGFPVFTRKAHTDVAYMACARQLLQESRFLYPQFATHNAHTIASVVELAGYQGYEFQRLHGMGQGLYDLVLAENENLACRVYAPVGGHAELLPYLVRRLLENGANTSFVNRISHSDIPIAEVVADPIDITRKYNSSPHPKIPLPQHLYGDTRKNSVGINFGDPLAIRKLENDVTEALRQSFSAYPLINGETQQGEEQKVYSPADKERLIGTVSWATTQHALKALVVARQGYQSWHKRPAAERAQALERAADLLEQNRNKLIALCAAEGGRILRDGDSEVREAADFCRYYAAQARARMGTPSILPGPSGEENTLALSGRGVFVCISPWNFPVAIFTGQISAALAAGNAVIAKPAEQTPISAMHVIQILLEAGVPEDVLQFLPGDGAIGATLVESDIDGVAFTGSTETAKRIEATLSQKHQRILPLIAETGGQNAMIVDSSALAEQVIVDVIESAFDSAGQRCSALRVLFLQEEIADKIITMLKGAMQELAIGDPNLVCTDIGPVISQEAKDLLHKHVQFLQQKGRLIYCCKLPAGTNQGMFFPPQAYEIDSIKLLKREVFGPILHIVRYRSDKLDDVISDINNTNYGLTFGIHSRIEETVDYIKDRIRAGNVYVNRNIIGAVVGVQPFGGEALSGTGPKAGGPHYLPRFCTERTVSDNIAAVGGNADLLSLND